MTYADAIDAVGASRALAVCAAEHLPRGLRRALARAEGLLRRAAAASSARATQFLSRAEKRLRAADLKATRAASRLSATCAAALEAAIDEALSRANCLG
jgi:hypothetical protein